MTRVFYSFQPLLPLHKITKLLKNPSLSILIFNSLVRSILEYCSPVWNPCYQVHSDRIERVQKSVLICNFDHFTFEFYRSQSVYVAMESEKTNLCEDYHIVDTAEKIEEIEIEEPPHYGYGVRHIQMLLLFLCLLIEFMTRSHLGVTIVAMTSNNDSSKSNTRTETLLNNTYVDYDHKRHTLENETQYDLNETIFRNENVSEAWNIYKTYPWPKSIQEMALSSFTLGYAIMMLPNGMICQRWGGKIVLQIALITNGIASFPIPWLTVWGGWKALCLCRILQGLSQAGISPAIHNIIANWVPISERCCAVSYVYTGGLIGTVVAYQLSGILVSSSWGWPSIYWITGILNLILFAAITIFLSNTPSQHKHISAKEKNFIMGGVNPSETKPEQKRRIAWRSIMCSKPVWICWGCHVSSIVISTFCNHQVPSYIHHVLQVNIRSSGLLSSLPYIASAAASFLYGSISDFLTNRKTISTKTARILFNSIGQFGPALCLALVPFTTNTALATTCFVTSMTLFAACHAGGMLSYIDLAPNYVGVLMAIGNSLAFAVQLMTPILVSHVVIDLSNLLQWRLIFLIIAGMPIVTNVLYIFFISAKKQPWNDYRSTTESEETKAMDEEKML